MNVEIINVSSKGQVVLPLKMRNQLKINSGDKLFIYCNEDSILIKKIKLPSKEEFENGIKENMMIAKESNLTEQDIFDAIKEVRSEKKQ